MDPVQRDFQGSHSQPKIARTPGTQGLASRQGRLAPTLLLRTDWTLREQK